MRVQSPAALGVLLFLVACSAGSPPVTNPPPGSTGEPSDQSSAETTTPRATATASALPTARVTPILLTAPPPPPGRSPLPSTARRPTPVPGEFTLNVYPAEEPVAARVAIPGEKIVFLVKTGGTRPAVITADATGTGNASVSVRVLPTDPGGIHAGVLDPGVVGEVELVTDQADGTLSLTITASTDNEPLHETRTVQMTDMQDERAKEAQPYFEKWVDWLIENRPDLYIARETSWDPEFVSTSLVVPHYAYWSTGLEMVVDWQNMSPPDDWTDVFLRRRGVDTNYTIGYRIDSFSADAEPHPADLPDTLIR